MTSIAIPRPAYAERPWILDWLTTVDHKKLGILYLYTTLFFFAVGGILALLVRTQLAVADNTFVNNDAYNQIFTMHASAMLFLFIIPVWAGFGNYIVPLQIGATDMAFPRINALSFWLIPPAGLLMFSGFLFGGASNVGWTAYSPLARGTGVGLDLWIIAVIILGVSSTIGAANFMVTMFRMRAPGMTMFRMPIFCWTMLVTAVLQLLATPVLASGLAMLYIDRNFGGSFFDPNGGGNAVLWQNIFWFYSHPAVYIMMLPGFGIISEVIATFARKPIFGYRALAFSTVAIAVLGFSVWAHHMFVAGMASWLRVPMMITTVVIAVPTGVKIFSWLGTLWQGRIHLKTPMLFALGFLFTFVIGGLSGVFLGTVPVDIHVSDTYFVVAHIHYVLFGGAVFTIFAGVYYWFPKMTGRMYNESLGRWHFWLTFIGMNATFLPMHWLGMMGMPRRVADYDDRFADLNLVISLASLILVVGVAIFFYNMIHSWARGPRAPWNPWRGRTLEWLVSSPPSLFNFDAVPQVVGGPYQYGVPGARHAIVFAPEDIGGEATEQGDRPIVVIANETLNSAAVLDEIRRRAAERYWRFVLLVPSGEEGRPAAERRLRAALAALAASGVPAEGEVVVGGPLEAAARRPADAREVILATYTPRDSAWMSRDVVDRVRKLTNLLVTHLVVTPEEARTPAAAPGVTHLMVLANAAIGGDALTEALLARADRQAIRVTLVCPLALAGPTWTDAAQQARSDAVARVREAVERLRAGGVQAQGEVSDGDASEALRLAYPAYRPDEVLVAADVAADLDALRPLAEGATVETLSLPTPSEA